MIRLPVLLKLFSFILLGTFSAFSQQDTSFWFAAPASSSEIGDSPIYFQFHSFQNPSVIVVSQPANPGFVPLSLTLGSFSSGQIDLTPFLSSIESPLSGVASNNGLKISATNNISATYVINSVSNKEDYSLKGQKGLGTNFYTPFQKDFATASTTPNSYSGIEIVASEDATTVLITPRAAVTGFTANTTFSVILQKGQTYSARDLSGTAITSLAGSIISADKKIAVTVHDGALQVGLCNDDTGDQITPTEALGKDHVIYKGQTTNDKVYILATQNATNLELSSSTTVNTLINWGETNVISLTDDVYHIKSSKPIYVYHLSAYGCNLSATQVPSINCKGNNDVLLHRENGDSLEVLLTVRAGFEGAFTLNGAPGIIQATDFVTVPGTLGVYKSCRKYLSTSELSTGSNARISNTTDIFTAAFRTGNGSNAATYSFLSDFSASAFSNAGLDDTICGNVNLPLSGVVGGGAITGVWTSNGFGTFQNGINSVPNTYLPSPLDSLVSPIRLILTISGDCPIFRDTMSLVVTPAPIVNANIDQLICENNSSILLNGIITGGTSTGIWSTIGTGVFVPNNTTLNATYVPSVADLSSGNVSFNLLSTNNLGCSAVSDNMLVNFSDAPIVDAGVSNITVCGNNSQIALFGSVSGSSTTGKWSTSGTGVFTPNTSSLVANYQASFSDTAAGFVWLYLESTSNGNCLTVFDSILVTITNAPIVTAGVNIISCTNVPTVTLNANVSSGFTGLWSGGGGVFSPNANTIDATYSPSASEISSGVVVLTLTSGNNGSCNAVADVMQINFVAPPFANFNANSVCESLPTIFTNISIPGSSPISSTTWNFGDTETSTTFSPQHIYAGNGNYPVTLTVTNLFGCVDNVTINTIVFDTPTAGFTYTANCPNNQIILDFDDTSISTEVLDYFYYDFGGLGSTVQENPSQPFIVPSTYLITHVVGTINNCYDTIIVPVAIDPLPVAGFYYNSTSGPNVASVFNFIDSSLYAYSYNWSFGDGNTSINQNPQNTFFTNANYAVTLLVTNELGCVDSITKYILVNIINNDINQLIPTIISPNNDSRNDYWKLEFIELLYPTAHIEIYNEWGQNVFISDGYSKPFDGTYKNEPLPDGNYFFIIDLNNETEAFKGVLMILRKGE